MKYCESIFRTKRWKTRVVNVGNVGVGGDNPVRIQSMTTSSTRDAQATVEQIIKLADYGCEIARVTVQGMKEADACEEIKNTLIRKGYTIPVVADIHFFPPAAMRVVDFVDKVRVNPGNFVDKRATFKLLEYDDISYAKELEKIEEKFGPLVEKCKKLGRAMRIGTNHGSLSDRIMNRYGDTPQGMVESALEFAQVCRNHDYHDFMFSMKSSNPQVMIQAYRLLVAAMMERGWDYPLHLGVTEAGQGEDGRIKSAMGIGALLLDGLGDTIRVSLTEDPWYEIDPCKRLVAFGKSYQEQGLDPFEEHFRDITNIARREVDLPRHVSLHRDGTVMVRVEERHIQRDDFYQKIGCGKGPKLKIDSADAIVLKEKSSHEKLETLLQTGIGVISHEEISGGVKLYSLNEWKQRKRFSAPLQKTSGHGVILVDECDLDCLRSDQPDLIFLSPKVNRLHYSRYVSEWLQNHSLRVPVILSFAYNSSQEDLVIQSSAELGALLCDGFGDGLHIDAPYEPEFLRSVSFGILQGARMRTFKTEFISCPSCGRTLFDLQDVTKRITQKTAHLPGVKIAIMGCIVNGPGEMADADFGYVGSKPGQIDLYVGKECVEKGIGFADADDRLIALIKSHGKWVEPVEV